MANNENICKQVTYSVSACEEITFVAALNKVLSANWAAVPMIEGNFSPNYFHPFSLPLLPTTRGVRSGFFNITKSVTDVYGGLSTIPVLKDVYASTFDELGDSTNQRSAMPDADWLSARDERGGGGPQPSHFIYPAFCLFWVKHSSD